MREIGKSNVAAFKSLFDLYYSYCMEIALLFCNKEDAEEIVSDVFNALWLKRTNVCEIRSLKNYLFVAIKNRCLNKLKNKQVSTVDIENIFDSYYTNNNPFNELVAEDLKKEIELEIERLPTKCKIVYQSVKIEGMKYEDAAKKLSISKKTIEKHLNKAKKRIDRILYKYNFLHS